VIELWQFAFLVLGATIVVIALCIVATDLWGDPWRRK
jgi:hypothetical protein